MTKPKFVQLVIFAIILLGVIAYKYIPKSATDNNRGYSACTMEAKLCPDGSYVSRSGPNCDFAQCPVKLGFIDDLGTGKVAGHIDIGPNCPVIEIDHPCPAPPQAYSSRQVVVYGADGTTIVQIGNIDASGNYSFALLPNTYFLQIKPAGIGPGEKKKVTVIVGQTSTVDFNVDTGIR